ncbi:serine hydrolase domain-containing protein [Caulobacter endophyticus]|uniref:serine hydrolase domain-containing protein n=1 Tax=Caulobacter endophyticus TaxID=2172652 RepID=UPI00240EB2F3|nr:serine hydrolase domain-containing protein [Caulobacter endophyticus]MDG2528713.1 serine hydrolase [Caulobacter endophyticus]
MARQGLGRRFGLATALALSLAWSGAPALAAPKDQLVAAAPESVGVSPERLGRLDALMKDLVATGHLPGATTMLVRHGKVVSFETYGARGFGGPPMTKDTIFRIYSQTKPVTGVAMMTLFEEGKWRLDDPVTKYVPELANLRVYKGVNADGSFVTEAADRPPTMREIMSHTAGFAYGLNPDNPVDKAYVSTGVLGSKSGQEFVERLAKLPLYGPPGKQWKYSVGVDIQGFIVEKLSGQSLPDFMQARIFAPLKMKDTGFWLPAEKLGRLADLYLWDGKAKKIVPAEGFMVLDVTKPPVVASGGGGLVSTNADYARFCQMLLNGGELDGARILSPASVKLMASDHLPDAVLDDPKAGFSRATGKGFGLDFMVITDPARAGTLAGKGTYSWGGAAGTWFWIDPENDLFFLGMIHVLAKDGDPALRDLSDRTATLVYQALVQPEK